MFSKILFFGLYWNVYNVHLFKSDKLCSQKIHVLCKFEQNIIFQTKTLCFTDKIKHWYHFCHFRNFLKAEIMMKNLAPSWQCSEWIANRHVPQDWEDYVQLEVLSSSTQYWCYLLGVGPNSTLPFQKFQSRPSLHSPLFFIVFWIWNRGLRLGWCFIIGFYGADMVSLISKLTLKILPQKSISWCLAFTATILYYQKFNLNVHP